MINFRKYPTITKVVIPNNVALSDTNFNWTFASMKNLNTVELPNDKLTNMYGTFSNCINLIGPPVCGENVIIMANAYYECKNLTGSPVCG